MVDIQLFTGVTSSQVSLLFLGTSVAFFITSSQLFLQSKEFDVFSIPPNYRDLLLDDCKLKRKKWAEFEDDQTRQCRHNEKWGRNFYNSAFFFLFIGLSFSIIGYSAIIAIIVASLGIGLEGWQWYSVYLNRNIISKKFNVMPVSKRNAPVTPKLKDDKVI